MKEKILFCSNVKKKFDSKVAALVYPGTYLESISNLGFQAVFSIINKSSFWYCERFVYSYKDGQIGLDSGLRLNECDAIFFSIGWEPYLFNLLDILSKSNLLNKKLRSIPVIVGGILSKTYQLRVCLEKISDYIYIGDAEKGLKKLLYDLYNNDDYFDVISQYKNKVFNLDNYCETESFSHIIAEESQFKSSFLISVMKGCVNKCGFCLLGKTDNKAVFLQPDKFCEIVGKILDIQEINSIGLVSTSPTQNPYYLEYLKFILRNNKKIGFSSLRIGNNINDEIIPFLKNSSTKSLTFAPDAMSKKIGVMIKKYIPFKTIMEKIIFLEQNNFFNFKFYYMMGISGETYDDLDEFCENINELIALNKKISLKISFSHFVPKAGTLMQDHSYMSRKEVKKHFKYLKRKLRLSNIELESNQDTIIQTMFSKKPQKIIKDTLYNNKFVYPKREIIKSWEKLLIE